MSLAALVLAALAGDVYINGVRADVLPAVTLTGVNVRLDAEGNVWIDAPGYRVQVLSPPDEPAPPARPASAVPEGSWWLVTEDDASGDQVLEVLVNGVLVRTVRSGDPQILLDLAPWLRRGDNSVVVRPVGSGVATGGAMSVYVGRGTQRSGTIHLNNPDVAYTRRAIDTGGARQYTVTVP